MSKARLLLVVGMHRSGTSLLMQALDALGARTGKEFLIADAHNQFGYYEDVRIVAAHDKILHALDRPWGTRRAVLPLPPGWWQLSEVHDGRAELAQTIRRELAAARETGQVLALKDPRMCRLLPVWDNILSSLPADERPEVSVLFGVRASEEVAASLQKRDAIPRDMGRLLWSQHNAEAIRHAGDRIEGVVRYDAWFDRPEAMLRHVLRALGRESGVAEARDRMEHVIRPDARRQRSTGAAEGLAGRLEAALMAWADTCERPSGLVDVLARYEEAAVLLRPWAETGPRTDLLDAVRERDATIGQLRLELAGMRHDLDVYRDAHDACRDAHDAAATRLDRTIQRILAARAFRGIAAARGARPPFANTAADRVEILTQLVFSLRFVPVALIAGLARLRTCIRRALSL